MFQFRRYFFELSAAALLYAAMLFGAAALENAFAPEGLLKLAVNVMPMTGALAMAFVIWRGLRSMDEFQRRMQFDAIALSFLGTALITFTWGFAEGAGLPAMSAFAVWPIMATLWVAALAVIQWRYR